MTATMNDETPVAPEKDLEKDKFYRNRAFARAKFHVPNIKENELENQSER